MKARITPIVLLCLFLLTTVFGLALGQFPARAAGPVVRAVLFFSPTCPHCHTVITEDLPPLVEKYGEQLEIVGIDTSQEVGMNLYQAMLARYNVPDDRIGVPTLVVGDQLLLGSMEIPEQFPGIIEAGLKSGGIDWPDIPGLQEVLAAQAGAAAGQAQAGATAEQAQPTPSPSVTAGQVAFVQRFMHDPLANTIAVFVLVGMIVVVIGVGIYFVSDTDTSIFNWPSWSIPVLALIGLGVALYLSYVEVTLSRAICGPVGDCNSVQESPYARLFGVLPVGVLGMLGYIAILLAWTVRKYGPESWESFLSLVMWGGSMFGVLFSIYLTFLEPFVIGATCAWCISSAIIITLLLLATTGAAREAFSSRRDREYEGDFDEFDDDEPEVVQDGDLEDSHPEDDHPEESNPEDDHEGKWTGASGGQVQA